MLAQVPPEALLQMNRPCADNRNIHSVILSRGGDAVTNNRMLFRGLRRMLQSGAVSTNMRQLHHLPHDKSFVSTWSHFFLFFFFSLSDFHPSIHAPCCFFVLSVSSPHSVYLTPGWLRKRRWFALSRPPTLRTRPRWWHVSAVLQWELLITFCAVHCMRQEACWECLHH